MIDILTAIFSFFFITQNEIIYQIPPEINLTGTQNITLTQNTNYIEQGYNITSPNKLDNRNITITTNFNKTKKGNYTIFYDYTDQYGNVATTVNRTITVI